MNLSKSLNPLYVGLAVVALAATVACNGNAAPTPAASTPIPVPAASVAPRPAPTPSVSAKFAGMLLGCDDGQANYSVEVQNIGPVPAAVYYRMLVGGQAGNWATTSELGSLQPGQRATLMPTIEHYVRGTPVSMQFGFNNITSYPVVTFSGIENNLELRCNTPTLVTIPTATATAVSATVTPTPSPTATPQPPTPTATATPLAGFTQEQLKQKLSSLDEILRVNEPVLDTEGKDYKGYAQKVQDVFEAGYYLTTGKTPQQNNIEVKILTDSDYAKFIDDHKLPSELKKTVGFNYSGVDGRTPDGKTTRFLLVRNQQTNHALETTVHEGGHAFAYFLNRGIGGFNFASAALRESQAYVFEAAWNRKVEEFSGKKILVYAKNPINVGIIREAMAFYEDATKDISKYDARIGMVLPWLRAREKGMLKLGEPLSAQQAYALFLDLVTTPKNDQDAKKFVNDLLSQISQDRLAFMEEHAVSRLVEGYYADKQGPGQLRAIDLLTP